MKKIIAVFKTHVDVGFTHLAEEVVKSFSETMPYAVSETCRSIKDFKWTMPAWPLYQAVRAGNEGAALAREFVEKGQLVWHGLPFTTHTEFCGTEEFIRGLYYSKALSEEFKKPLPVSAKMTDVPGHTWGLVPMLAKAGIKFLHLGCNPACTPPDVPLMFYWESPDGSRILTFYNKGAYGSSLLPPEDWEYPVWLAMQQTNDNTGPQKAEAVREMYRQAEGFELVLGTLDDFYHDIEPYLDDSIPVVRGDLADTWIHGVGSYPKEVASLRELRYKITKQEAELALENKGDAVVDKAYENCLLFGEHTWGLDVKTYLGYARRYDREGFQKDKALPAVRKMEESWDEQRKRACGHGITATLHNDFSCTSLLENERIKLSLESGGMTISDKRTGTVFSGDGFGVFQYDIFSNADITEFIRSYSYRFFDWSVNDLGRMGYPEIAHRTILFDNMRVGGNKLEAEDSLGQCCENIEITASVHREKPYVDLTYTIKNKTETPLVESGHIVFPFRLNNDYQVEFSKTAGVSNCESDIVKNANHAMYCCEKWINLFDGEKGILIIPVSNPLFSVGENMVYQFRGEFEKQQSTVFINLFNNAWGTNFPQWIGGTFTFKIRLCPYTGRMSNVNASRIANETVSDFGIHSVAETESDIELLALKKSFDGKGTVLRLKSTSGHAQTIMLKPKFDYKRCSYTTLLEDVLYAFDGGIEIKSAPYEIHTLYFER